MQEDKNGGSFHVEDARTPAYHAVIPASVRYDPELRPSAKLLYGELTALADMTGYCWASNRYFAKLYRISDKTVSELLLQLERRGHIRREVVRNERNEVVERRIYAGTFIVVPSPEKSGEGSPEKSGDPPPKNRKENNTSINDTRVTPIAPKGGDAGFDEFWRAYPKKVGKKAAQKAYRKANVPAGTLLAALERQKRSDQWSRDGGRYIPNPATWLNQGRWEDEIDDPAPADPDGEEELGWL